MTRDDLRAALENVNVKAFLAVIRAGETSNDPGAYNELFGGEHFDSYADHPRKVVVRGEYRSTAAGAYQVLAKTFDGVAKQYGFTDFSPATQDQIAVALIAGRHAIEAVITGNLDEAIRLCCKEWASLPGSPYGQPTRTLEKATQTYLAYGGTLADSPVPIAPDTSAPKEVKPVPIFMALLPSLLQLLPQLGQIFSSGSEVATRNIAAASIVTKAITDATQSPNLQAAIERMQDDPTAVTAAHAALADVWPSITEAGSGGLDGARKAAGAPDQLAFYKQGVFWITVGLMPLVYVIVLAALGKWEYIGEITSETRAQVIGTALGTLLGGIIGYFYGTSAGSQRKTEIAAK